MPVPGGADAIITLADAKTHLNIPATSTTHDDELQYFVDAACVVIAKLAGEVLQRDVTEIVRQRGGVCSLMLAARPVVSVTTMTSIRDGAAYDVTALYVDNPLAGIVRRTDGGAVTGGPWTVTYVAGRADVPANIGLAARILVQHLWETQRGGSMTAPRLDVEAVDSIPGLWFAIPDKVKQLLEGETAPLMAF